MQCAYYQNKQCLSCQWMEIPYQVQFENKQIALSKALTKFNPTEILPPFSSQESTFRNKAKMTVLGLVENPILGIQTGDLPIDLCDCPLYSRSMQTVLKIIRTYIRKHALVPYNIKKRTGELKFILLTESSSGFMLRFVLKTDKYVEKIQSSLHQLQNKIQNLQLVSINIQPKHAAIIEGDKELILTENHYLPFPLNNVPLFIKSKSFFQTNTNIAASLYKTASNWVIDLKLISMWDLFCGVGGFGLHCVNAHPNTQIKLIGIEIDPDAIDCATKSAKELGYYQQLTFRSLDAAQYTLNQEAIPDLVLVNPPRRGVGQKLMHYLAKVEPNFILYSSCNLDSLTQDLQLLPNYQIEKVKLFDMFPHTPHMEVLTLLSKRTKYSNNYSSN